ncbi:MAG: hypothetical protein H7234_02920 [Herminiimonas sp.]|nr:hypothetical protein [Herminiimonas sp.]
MATTIRHHGINIVTLHEGDDLVALCAPGDIVLEQDGTGWWTRFVDDDGRVESYDAPFENYNKALWTAKAAAEFQAE